MYYQDMMDPSRLVKIVSTEKTSAHCRVYFKDRDLNKEPSFVGFAPVPTSLFSEHYQNQRVGFTPWNREAEIERARQEKLAAERRANRYREDEYEEDY